MNIVIEKSQLLYDQARERAEEELNRLYSNPEFLSSSGSGTFSVLTSIHKRVNFITGNTRLSSLQQILWRISTEYIKESTDEWKFIDLGCGNGECLAAV